MKGVAICTDSSALFPAGVAESLGIIRVPVAIALDGEPYDTAERGIGRLLRTADQRCESDDVAAEPG